MECETKTNYLRRFEAGGSDAMWIAIKDRCPTQKERQDELERLEADGWFVFREYKTSDVGRELDGAAFARPAH
ncbi:hypothetical protein KHC28_00815 [Ancylobacter sonchi]|uniref:hypothetical protein n=1 Tax=Ancylobacter sonchi TaxID=1937790 RepID=UPI001BD5F974|nr:hypothetical protein [Ancylobacter sonchi]MBS7532205.1 hypothetical protein [Ancylobacter sonchi]